MQVLEQLEEFHAILEELKHKRPVQVTGVLDSGMVHFMEELGSNFRYKVIVSFSALRAKEIYEDYKCFDKNVLLYPARDFIFYNADIHGNLMTKERLNAIKEILSQKELTIITTIDGLMDRLAPKENLLNHILEVKVGEKIDLEEYKEALIDMGYERMTQVEAPGQFAIRGSILDVFSLTEEVPFRIDLWDDEVDMIKSFDVDSQRSIEQLEQIEIYPAAELVLDKQRIEHAIEKITADAKMCEKQFRDKMMNEEAHRIWSITKEITDQLRIGITGLSLDSYINYFFDETVTFLDYFQNDETLFFLEEPRRISDAADAIELEFRESMMHRMEKGYLLPLQADVLVEHERIFAKLNQKRTVLLTMLEQKLKIFDVVNEYHIEMRNVNPYNNSFETLVKDIKQYKKRGYGIMILAASRTRGERIVKDLFEFDLQAFYDGDVKRILKPGEVMVSYGNIHKGFEYPLLKYVVISESDIFGAEKKKRKKKKKNFSGQQIASFTDLTMGDYVIHENHGLGIYRGIEKIEVDKVQKDYIKIEYADKGNLYVPVTSLDMISKYAGSDAKKPKLHKLGAIEWNKTKTRVRHEVQDIAEDLVELYAKRQARKGFVYSQDSVWQREFEEMFPYEETEDQLNAIEAIKKDMESPKIMDRLVCGDVGYGKTEVAIRAAFKAVQDGKQVAILAPTTILAQQHYNTFVQRFKEFPVQVDLMCRFRTPAQQKQTIKDLKKGFVDILIGTHRILSKDIEFKDLGLLIIDEEQRFGVKHKEKIKQWKENIDVVTLTATPIPRTLHMSLIGIRDMSVLEEPPVDRMPIQTYVMEYNDEMVREAIQRELARGGQVYYVYNRVNNIEEIASNVQKLVPEANVSYAHGQMSERRLETIMYDFINGEIDVLVSTTIIETGLDISNANTMIIHDADQLGLSQLYQLRGRVGRSSRTSYAFLMYRRDKMLKEVAEKRLSAIKEFTQLGAGFKIAMKDLEIRGAGNLLGTAQHGHMQAVGYDLYCKMLNEAVMHLKGEEVKESFETSIDVDIDAYIPATYIKNEALKLDIYKRIAAVENDEERMDMEDELMDRFGELPKPAWNLLQAAVIKNMANRAYITDIKGTRREIRIIMYERAKIDINKIPDLLKKMKQNLRFQTDKIPCFFYEVPKEIKTAEDYLLELKRVVQEILGLVLKDTERKEEKNETS